MIDQRTRWGYIALLLTAGVVAAMQVGKVPPAILDLSEDLHLGIVAAAWVLSLFSAIGAVLGCVAGSIANRFGARAVTVVALLGMAASSALGARADGAGLLLFSRALEGTAFVAAVVAIPSLLVASASAGDRRFVTGMWGTYMPTGMAIALTLAPSVLIAFGWRAFWNWNAVLLLLVGIGLLAARQPGSGDRGAGVALDAVLRTMRQREVWLLALIFMCYTFQFLSVLGFLPTILEQQGVPPQAAGTQTAIAVIANAGGNIAASWLVARRVAPPRLMAFALVVMVACELGIYSPAMPADARYGLAVAFSAFGGLLPAAVFATIPAIASRAASGAVVMGVVVQASHIGQLTGPPVVAAISDVTGGWSSSPLALVPAAAVAFVAAFGLRRALRSAEAGRPS
ncbi:MAG TPA: MFS transporter [Gammaproteobacteria bacterium]